MQRTRKLKLSLSLSLTFAALLFSSTPLLAKGRGTADTGGDFQFYRTEIGSIMQSGQTQLLADVGLTPESLFAEAFAPYSVDKAKLIGILERVVLNLGAPAMLQTNPNGEMDRKRMHYSFNANNEPQIEVLSYWVDDAKAFLDRAKNSFDLGVRKILLGREYPRYLFREALHHFGILDDDLAFKLSENYYFLGRSAQAQTRACEKYLAQNPQARCLKSWELGYEYLITKEIRNWHAGISKEKNDYLLLRTDGVAIAFNTGKPRTVQMTLDKKYGIAAECKRESATARLCETGGLFDKTDSVSIEYSRDFAMETLMIFDPFLAERPELLSLRRSSEGKLDEALTYPVIILTNKAK